ncbi:MAG: response regulator transcription factor [Sphaerochaetaceae bacterium]
MKHLYVVEDHDAIRDSVAQYLELSGYKVSKYALIHDAAAGISQKAPDLLIQDVMMPDGDGFSFVKFLRTQYAFPVIFMTARGEESDRIMGFELGGDDYIVKPFSPKELVLRVEAIFRRMDARELPKKHGTEWKLEESVLLFDELSHGFSLDGQDINLTAAEWRIISHLIENAGNLVSRSQILEACFDYSFESYDRIVDTHIKNIRAKIGINGINWIETVRGYGYRFSGVLSEATQA